MIHIQGCFVFLFTADPQGPRTAVIIAVSVIVPLVPATITILTILIAMIMIMKHQKHTIRKNGTRQ